MVDGAEHAPTEGPACSPPSCASDVFLVVSRTSEPRTLGPDEWLFYAAISDGQTRSSISADRPNMGVNRDALVIAFSVLGLDGTGYTGSRVRILDKAKVARGESLGWRDFWAMRNDSGQY